MAIVTRSAFLRTAGVLPATLFAGDGEVMRSVSNDQFRLSLDVHAGLKVTLTHAGTGLVLARGEYSYSFGAPAYRDVPTDGTVVVLKGVTPELLEVRHEFRFPTALPWFEEQITLTNRSPHAWALPHARCGFLLPADAAPKTFRLTAVPYRAEPYDRPGYRREKTQQYADFAIEEVLEQPRRSHLRSGSEASEYAEYASEGWLLTDSRSGFLVTKYSQTGMEFSLFDRAPLPDGEIALRWGGCGTFQGDPVDATWLPPGASYRFGVTRVTAYRGGMVEGFYTFRAEMEERGHGCPRDFNPPVHWNELYDNKLWWLGEVEADKPENRQRYYGLADMKDEAAKAIEFGCEALYLDPGWDTNFASKIWDQPRLGSLRDFVEMMRRDYGLSVSLHTPLSGWCNATTYSRDIDRMTPAGSRLGLSLCGASKQYLEETLARLDVLARDGVTFFMFDGTGYHGDCWDPAHGHAVPSTREEHVQATDRLARMVHARHPRVLIEMHDQLAGGTNSRLVPTYYGHGMPPEGSGDPQAPGFDTVWAFELMEVPLRRVLSRQSLALYYYNLAYALPLYLHIDLRDDNEHALSLWWYASTCRHLGIGGTHKDPAVRKAQKAGMVAYRRLKPFFAAGTFYGIDEVTHVHRHPTAHAAVINCFNLEDQPVSRIVEFDPVRFGLDRAHRYEFTGAPHDGHRLQLQIPARGHLLVEMHSRGLL